LYPELLEDGRCNEHQWEYASYENVLDDECHVYAWSTLSDSGEMVRAEVFNCEDFPSFPQLVLRENPWW
jgi:hypothetical protein